MLVKIWCNNQRVHGIPLTVRMARTRAMYMYTRMCYSQSLLLRPLCSTMISQ